MKGNRANKIKYLRDPAGLSALVTTPTLRLKVVTSAERPGRQSVFIEVIMGGDKGRGTGDRGMGQKTWKRK